MKLKEVLNKFEWKDEYYIQTDLKMYLEEDCVIGYDLVRRGSNRYILIDRDKVFLRKYKILIQGKRKFRVLYVFPELYTNSIKYFLISRDYNWSNTGLEYSNKGNEFQVSNQEKYNQYIKQKALQML